MCIWQRDWFLEVNLLLTADGRPALRSGCELMRGQSQIMRGPEKKNKSTVEGGVSFSLFRIEAPGRLRPAERNRWDMLNRLKKMPSASFVFFFFSAAELSSLLWATDYPSWQDPPPTLSVRGTVYFESYMFMHVCARANVKQISVISPVEAQAQRELIIHTVTVFTVAPILPSLCLGAWIQIPSQRLSDQHY